MLALPLQGFAAASMRYCSVDAGHHAKAKHANASRAPTSAKQLDGSQLKLPDESHACGACASCCSVIAIAHIPPKIDLKLFHQAYFNEPFVLIFRIPTGLPEKPPRSC